MSWPEQPYCECGDCHLQLLPPEAWDVAGPGDLKRVAVLPGHEEQWLAQGEPVEDHGRWLAVG